MSVSNAGSSACITLAVFDVSRTLFCTFQSDLPNLRKTFPLLIFGVLGIAAGLMAFWLPETITSQMPQTVEQAEAWDEDYKIYCCKKPKIHAPKAQEIEMEVNDLKEEKEEETTV